MPHPPAEPAVFSYNQRARRLERRRNEVGGVGLGHGPHECGSAARGLPRENVALRVPDYPRTPEVDVELAREPKDHSGARLSTVASSCLVVRAIAERLDGAAVLGQIALDAELQRAQRHRIQHPK
jgi:hypothetical protein